MAGGGAGYYRRHGATRPEPSPLRPRGGLWCQVATKEAERHLLKHFDDGCKTLAIGEGYFAVERDGGTYWHSPPRFLYNKVNGRQKTLPPVDYVALGEDSYYFVQFADGDWQLSGPESLLEALRECQDATVDVLAFAPHDGWYVLWDDGSYAWEGLPRALHNQLNGRQKSLPGVEDLAVGPRGEWWVRLLDGDWHANGLSDSCSEALDEIQADGFEIGSMAFGQNSSWAIRYG